MEDNLILSITKDTLGKYLVNTLSEISTENKVCLEFIVNNGNIIYINYSEAKESLQSSFVLSLDGICNYYRMIIPTLEYYNNEGIYTPDYHYFFFNNKIYKSLQKTISIETIEEECEEITDINSIWEIQDSNILSYTSKLFSTYNLEKCILYKTGDTLEEFIKNGCIKCRIDEYLSLQRDFLISSLYVINILINKNEYEEAERILNTIESCSNSLCQSYYNISKDCNCGKSR